MHSIAPFFETVSRWALASDFLNPSEYALRMLEAKESIVETLKANPQVDLFDRVRKAPVEEGKALRVASRALFSLALGLVVAPAGGLYHAFQSLKHISEGYLRGAFNWDKVQRHKLASVRDWTYFGANVAGLLTPAIYTTFVLDFPIWFYPKEERMLATKAYLMRKDFGLVTKNGDLLPSNQKDDEKLIIENGPLGEICKLGKGSLGEIWKIQTLQLLNLIQQIQYKLPPHEKLPISENPNGAVIARIVETKKAILSQRIDNVDESIGLLKKTQERIDCIKELLQKCISTKYDSYNLTSFRKFTLRPCCFNAELVREFYTNQLALC